VPGRQGHRAGRGTGPAGAPGRQGHRAGRGTGPAGAPGRHRDAGEWSFIAAGAGEDPCGPAAAAAGCRGQRGGRYRLADGEHSYGALTLVPGADERPLEVADLGLVEELGEQVALAIKVDRMFVRRSEVVEPL
jgi:hypothetical protein